MDSFSKSVDDACISIGLAGTQNSTPVITVPSSANILTGLINASNAHAMRVPAREWIVDGLVPVGGVTFVTGAGGEGKTLLAQQMATCVSAGVPFLGRPTMKCTALGLFGEDDDNELIRRQQSIMSVEGIAPHQVDHYHFKSLFGQDTLLGGFDRYSGAFVPAPLYQSIRETALQYSVRLIILDNSTQMYSGDVNDRGPVVRFIQILNQLALDINGSVVLLGHIAKSEGSTYSGSTAWRDGVRQAFQIVREETRGVPNMGAMESNGRIIKITKSNYSAIGEDIKVRWDRGAFVLNAASATGLPSASRTHSGREAFLENLRGLTADAIAVSASKRAKNYAPKVMSGYSKVSISAMESALESLLADGLLDTNAKLPWLKSNRHPAMGVAVRESKAPATAPAPSILQEILTTRHG